ncbi:hypothetical protein [Methanobacterium formicicum]|mgnify:CR=1 FL=1|uniref:Uncharacterized protein n=1 Tax=Methanobacterium formicicum TaxID=2162 RepID=A0A090JYG9_METFO|nr:hypothetical protein [Methanobacterium formicicum]MDH2658550.1 hypothetical protein [Methanobacterium formicicum]CEA14585.1 hypothetical protein DSM1535_2261 [Methanobacterium formicicum]
MFDPKKIMDTAIDQVQKTGKDSYRSRGEIDDILYKMSRDLEELRMKNRELSERLNDLDMQFNHLKSLLSQNNRRY